MNEIHTRGRKVRLLSCLLWVSLSALGASAAPENSAQSLSIQEIGKRASENAAFLKAQSRELQSARLEVEGAGLLPNPSIAVQLGGLRSGDSSGMTVESTLTQVVPFPGKRKNQTRFKELESKITEASLEQAKILLQHEASLRALQWVVLNEQANHFREREKRFRLIRDFLKSRPLVSPAAKAESYLVEGQIELLEKRFAEIEQEKNSIELELRYFLQVSGPVRPETNWITPDSLPARTESKLVVAASPELRKKQLEIAQAETAVERASLQPLPDIALGAGYRNEAVSPANHFYYGSIALTIPLFDRGQYAEPAARAKLEAERARESLLLSKISQEVEKAWLRLSAAKEMATKFSLQRIKEIDRRFSEVDREFRKGRVTTSVLLQTDSQLHDTAGAVYEAQLTLGQRLSELRLLTGEPLSWK